jgi:N utilization substance protein B
MSVALGMREDARREWTLWVLFAREMAQVDARLAFERIEETIVGSSHPPTSSEASSWYRIPRFEDAVPSWEDWNVHRTRVLQEALVVETRAEEVDRRICDASPRWRVERMPPVDRTLLRMGVAELVSWSPPRPRATINGLIELAKVYGEESTPKFTNGILDQIRRNLEIPFE